MLTLKQHDSEPLYVQIYRQIRDAVLSGGLAPGAKLPSVRQLSEELSVSRNTAENAYQELLAEGYIQARARSGCFVADIPPDIPPPPPSPKAPQAVAPLPEEGGRAPFAYDFHPALLDPGSFPAAFWRKHAAQCLRDFAPGFTRYGDPQGEASLRAGIREYLRQSRGVVCEEERIFVCCGLQHSLDMVARLLRGRCRTLICENPGYPLPRVVFDGHGYALEPLAVGPAGLDPATLPEGGGRVAYTTPSHQFPLGHVLPVGDRLKLLQWAARWGNFIIEDDYDSELRYIGRPVPCMQGLDAHGRVIYTGTFSKTLSPALRASYMVLPRELAAACREAFRHHLPAVPLLEQQVLALFLAQGGYARHVRRMRAVYKRKHNALLLAVQRHFGARAQVTGHGAGLHVVLQLRGCRLSEGEMLARAGEKGIRLIPFSMTLAGKDAGPPRLLLGFGGMEPERADEGLRLLAEACR